MPATLGTQPALMDDTTMIVYRGSRKPVPSDRKRDLARRCGVNCIKLYWKGNLTSTIGVCGFQHVKLRVMPKPGGGKEPSAQWDQNEFTLEARAEGAMDFVPDEMGVGWAYLPDSAYNRVMLAKAEIGRNALWEIDDEGVKKEIEQLAIEIQKSIEHINDVAMLERKRTEVQVEVQKNNIRTGNEQMSRLELENLVLEQKIRELEAQEKRDLLKQKLAALQAKRPDLVPAAAENPVETPAAPTLDDMPAPRQISAAEKTDIRLKAKSQIYAENPELIENVKKVHVMATGKESGWAMSKEYREQIAPLIEERARKLIDEYSATGDAD